MATSPEPTFNLTNEITASICQIAVLNNLLPKGFRFELSENVAKCDVMNTGKRKKTVIGFGLR